MWDDWIGVQCLIHIREYLVHLKSCFVPSQVRAGGYTAREMILGSFSYPDLKLALFTVPELKLEGFTVAEIRKAGYPADEVKEAGFNAKEMKSGGFELLIVVGVTQMALFTVAELLEEGQKHTHTHTHTQHIHTRSRFVHCRGAPGGGLDAHALTHMHARTHAHIHAHARTHVHVCTHTHRPIYPHGYQDFEYVQPVRSVRQRGQVGMVV